MNVERSKVMDTDTWKVIIIGAILVLGIIFWYICIGRPQEKKEEEEASRRASREAQESILRNLSISLGLEFGVELETIHESNTQDEIVRIVNLRAIETANSCVHEDKKSRRGSSADSSRYEKNAWYQARSLALQICPELKNRLPHFSEFEPLKSYNAKNLLRKKAKRDAVVA